MQPRVDASLTECKSRKRCLPALGRRNDVPRNGSICQLQRARFGHATRRLESRLEDALHLAAAAAAAAALYALVARPPMVDDQAKSGGDAGGASWTPAPCERSRRARPQRSDVPVHSVCPPPRCARDPFMRARLQRAACRCTEMQQRVQQFASTRLRAARAAPPCNRKRHRRLGRQTRAVAARARNWWSTLVRHRRVDVYRAGNGAGEPRDVASDIPAQRNPRVHGRSTASVQWNACRTMQRRYVGVVRPLQAR